MKAFHSTWTRPYMTKQVGRSYEVEDFELLTTILSALKWQALNGDIEMVTDEVGADFYSRIGLDRLWNLGMHVALDEIIPRKVDPYTFWAAGKLYALGLQEEPCVMLDTDFIIWETINHELINHEITVIHKENIEEGVYPPKERLKVSSTYHYLENCNWEVLPCNTAFTFFKDPAFKAYYVEEAKRFMMAVEEREPLIYMVFAEQRLLAMCAKAKGKELFALSSTQQLFHSGQKRYTHVWGYKRQLRADDKLREVFCKRCIARIKKDFPLFYPTLYKIPALEKYFY